MNSNPVTFVPPAGIKKPIKKGKPHSTLTLPDDIRLVSPVFVPKRHSVDPNSCKAYTPEEAEAKGFIGFHTRPEDGNGSYRLELYWDVELTFSRAV